MLVEKIGDDEFRVTMTRMDGARLYGAAHDASYNAARTLARVSATSPAAEFWGEEQKECARLANELHEIVK